MSLCDDSQVTSNVFYTALNWIYEQRNCSLATYIYNISNKINNLYTMYYPNSWPGNQWAMWFVTCWRCIFASIIFCFYYMVSLFLTLLYNRIFWGSQNLLDICNTGTGVSYVLYLSFWEGIGFSYANLHFSYTFLATPFTELPSSIATITEDNPDGVLDSLNELGFTMTFNIADLDLSKLPIFKKPEEN